MSITWELVPAEADSLTWEVAPAEGESISWDIPADSGSFNGDHNDLDGRDEADAHPIAAITGLEDALANAGPGVVETIVEGDNITVDATDPANPVVSAPDVLVPEVSDGEWRIQVMDPDGVTVRGHVGYSVSEGAVAFWGGAPGVGAYDKPTLMLYDSGDLWLQDATGGSWLAVDAGALQFNSTYASLAASGQADVTSLDFVTIAGENRVRITSQLIELAGLPTSDPASEFAVWNDNGVLRVSGTGVALVLSVNGETGEVVLTAADVGAIPTTAKGTAGGVAELDGSGFVPSAQLPSFVDDVIEAANFAALPGTGATGKIYVTIDDGKTYRWSGSVYVEISSSLALGETSSTAYRGDRGKIAFDFSQAVVPIAQIPTGTSGTTVPLGNDARFSDQRTPSDNSVTSAKIVDGAIVNADINASAAIDQSKISGLVGDLSDLVDADEVLTEDLRELTRPPSTLWTVDTFTRPDGPLGSGWIDAADAYPDSFEPLRILSGNVTIADATARSGTYDVYPYGVGGVNAPGELYPGIGCAYRDTGTPAIDVTVVWGGKWNQAVDGIHLESTPLVHVTPGTHLFGFGVWIGAHDFGAGVKPYAFAGYICDPPEDIVTNTNCVKDLTGIVTHGVPAIVRLVSDGLNVRLYINGTEMSTGWTGANTTYPFVMDSTIAGSTMHGFALDGHLTADLTQLTLETGIQAITMVPPDKATPINADSVAVFDSATNTMKGVTGTNLKAFVLASPALTGDATVAGDVTVGDDLVVNGGSAIVQSGTAADGKVVSAVGTDSAALSAYTSSSDSAPVATVGELLGSPGVYFGPGGSSGFDVSLVRTGTSAAGFTGAISFGSAVTAVGAFTAFATTIWDPSAATSITSNTTQLAPTKTLRQVNPTAARNLGSGATAIFSSNGVNGQECMVRNTSTNVLTLTAGASSGVKHAGGAAAVLSQYSSITYVSDGTFWIEKCRSII